LSNRHTDIMGIERTYDLAVLVSAVSLAVYCLRTRSCGVRSRACKSPQMSENHIFRLHILVLLSKLVQPNKSEPKLLLGGRVAVLTMDRKTNLGAARSLKTLYCQNVKGREMTQNEVGEQRTNRK